MTHHFLLTRFNLNLWRHDKNGDEIDREKWLGERLQLFETYCLPSVVGQTCLDFVWILLIDANTPEVYKARIKAYEKSCPNIKFIVVKSQYGFEFASVFGNVVSRMLAERGAKEGDVCLTTYFDNDDCLNKSCIADVQKYCEGKNLDNTFLAFDYGLQYYTELELATRICYPNNHFMTLVEKVALDKPDNSIIPVKTCFGYGSHFMLEGNKYVSIKHIVLKDKPMWIEVIHKDNVDNDVKMTLDTKVMRKDSNYLIDNFSIDVPLSNRHTLMFYLRCIKQMFRRTRDKFIARKW